MNGREISEMIPLLIPLTVQKKLDITFICKV
ncbi:MAG: hypothetical protein DDT29_01553 [Dehalococcoidia bacterium]|nr:hypothetical protein [Bacillota bacterium]MBT9166650.1 hypothetical protein [Chloroflexota bacterium]